MNFHLPYHFVPFFEGDRPATDRAAARHDRYTRDSHSGRIVCRIETKTPIFAGAKRHEGTKPVRVDQYALNGQLAIPGSALRGMVGSVAEAASNSAYRVLNTRAHYSVRKPMQPKHTLSAIGVVIKGADGSFSLQPLSIPTLPAGHDGSVALPREFQHLFPQPLLKVYVGGKSQILRDTFAFRTFRLDAPKWYAMLLEKRVWAPGFRLSDDPNQHRKPYSRKFLLGQTALNGREPIPYERFLETVPEAERPNWTLGVMRVLGCWGNRVDSTPPDKKHELFLPWPTDPNWPTVGIPQRVIDDFHEVCDARTESSLKAHERDTGKNPLLPFEPRDTRSREGRSVPEEGRKLRVQHGDLVYFGVDAKSNINEISFSAIWRARKEPSGAFFPKSFWPYDPTGPAGPRDLTPAELLLGFVEDRNDKPTAVAKSDGEPGNPPKEEIPKIEALASRVRFSAAILVPKPGASAQLPEVTLRVLDSPKPPCPALYFKPKRQQTGGFVSKMDLNSTSHVAQGRKFYLHQKPDKQWESHSEEANEEQQVIAAPIAAGQEFFFHVDFDNLTAAELGLLLYSLSPSTGFQHKIGMAKALGLGSIKVEPLAYLRVIRERRFTPDGLTQARFHEAYVAADPHLSFWPACYQAEHAVAGQPGAKLWEPLRDQFRNAMSPQLGQALDLVGDPSHVTFSVAAPLIAGQTDPEAETFKWFVANETGLTDKSSESEIMAQHQFLAPLNGRVDLPVLKQPHWQIKSRRDR